MKQKVLYFFSIILLLFGKLNTVNAQLFGAELSGNGTSSTIFFGNGVTITTNSNGTYNTTGSGTCSGCIQTLPGVTVYGVRNTSTSVTYTSYSYQGQYYQMPVVPTAPPNYVGASSQVIVNTNPTPVVVPLPPIIASPCKGYNNNNINPASKLSNPAYANTIASMTSTLGADKTEKSSFIGNNSATGAFQASPISISPSATQTAPTNIQGLGMLVGAGIHTHPNSDYPTPSAGDIFSVATINGQYPSYNTTYVLGADGTRSALVVADPIKAAAFLSQYPMATNFDTNTHSWLGAANATSGLLFDYNAVYNQYNPTGVGGALDVAAYERANAFILDKYDTGITMVKADATGTFKEVHTAETKNAAGKSVYSIFNCN